VLFDPAVAGGGGVVGGRVPRCLRLGGPPAFVLAPYALPLTPFRRFLRFSRRLDRDLCDLIARKRARGADEGDVVSALLRARDADGTAMTDDELVGQANVLFLAGHETTANTLTWTLFLLAQHPRVAADLFDELHGKLRGDAPTPEQLAELPLLDRVVKESMRVLTVVPLSQRVAAAEVTLGPHRLPPKTEVIFSPYVTHHLPE